MHFRLFFRRGLCYNGAIPRKGGEGMAFEIFPWGPLRRYTGERDTYEALMDMKECGFTGSCFLEPEDGDACRAAGLAPTYFLFDETGAISPEGLDPFYLSRRGRANVTLLAKDKSATPQTIDAVMRAALARIPKGPAKVYISDEPGATWLPRVRQMADCVARYRSDLTPYINLFPNYAVCGDPDISQLETETFEEYLAAFCRAVPDMPVSIDNYMVFVSKEFSEHSGEARFYQNYVQVREACDRFHRDFHHVICSNQLRAFQPIPTFSNLLLQATTSLAAGARSVSWFTYFGRGGYLMAPVDDNTDRDVRTGTWYLLREVNRRLFSWGSAIFPMDYEGLYFTHPDAVPRAHALSECADITHFSADGPCVCGVYRDGGEPVVFVVNCSLQKSIRADIAIRGQKPMVWSVEEGKWREPILTTTQGSRSPMWIGAGDAVLMRGRRDGK